MVNNTFVYVIGLWGNRCSMVSLSGFGQYGAEGCVERTENKETPSEANSVSMSQKLYKGRAGFMFILVSPEPLQLSSSK